MKHLPTKIILFHNNRLFVFVILINLLENERSENENIDFEITKNGFNIKQNIDNFLFS